MPKLALIVQNTRTGSSVVVYLERHHYMFLCSPSERSYDTRPPRPEKHTEDCQIILQVEN